jgi:hypothetical protein
LEFKYRLFKEVSSNRVEGTEPVKRLVPRCRYDNFVSDPREDGTGPTRELAVSARRVRPVRVERVEGTEPVKRLVLRYRADNFVSDPRKDSTGPTRELE